MKTDGFPGLGEGRSGGARFLAVPRAAPPPRRSSGALARKTAGALLIGWTLATAARAEPPPGYRLVWSDEFNAGTLDTNRWHYRTGARMLSRQLPDNVSVTNGLLRLALKKEEGGGLHYTGGGVISRRAFTYGYYEACFRCPKPAGWHTAFWAMQYPLPARRAQEIDFCEQDSVNHRSYSAGVMDWSGRTNRPASQFGRVYYHQPTVPDFAANFHVWGCEFTPAEVKFFLDGQLTHATDATRFPHGPQNVWLSCIAALWGKPKAPKQMDDAGLPAFADFDWVRVYEKAKP